MGQKGVLLRGNANRGFPDPAHNFRSITDLFGSDLAHLPISELLKARTPEGVGMPWRHVGSGGSL